VATSANEVMATATTINIYFYQKEQQSTGGHCRNSGALVMAPAQQAVNATIYSLILLAKQQSTGGDIG